MLSAFGLGLLLLVGYTYAGYPAVVTLWARVRPLRFAVRSSYEPMVSACLAVHDGAAYLPAKLQSLQALDYPKERLEIIVYSDGSRDETEAVVQLYAQQDPRIRLISAKARQGKPTALNALAEAARGEVLFMTDVRQTLSRDALRALLAPLSDPRVGCVSGNLVLEGAAGASAYWRYEKLIRSAESALGAMVGVSGSIYAIRREDFVELPADVLLDDMFVPLTTVRRQKHIVMAPAAEAYDRAYADEQEFSRKARTLAGNFQLVEKLPWLLLPGANPVWFQLWSHKLLRLVCPFALVALLFTSHALAWGERVGPIEAHLWQALVVAEWLFYALALCGAKAGRLGSLARTFVILNAAALVGLWRFLRRSQRIAW